MKKSILNLKGSKELNKEELKAINGGSGCWLIVCGITKQECIDEHQGWYNKNTGCCGFVPLSC